jgi:hypothetical protein
MVLLFLILAISLGRPAPDLQMRLVPRSAPPGSYEVYVSTESIDVLAARLRAEGSSWPPGAWEIERLEPLDAFGADGPYDRFRLAFLFAGQRPRVARGPLIEAGRSQGVISLVSPYPTAQFDSLDAGTLIIVRRLNPDLLRP